MALTTIPQSGLWGDIADDINANFTQLFQNEYQAEVLSPTPNTSTPEADNADVDLATNWQSLYVLTTPVIPAGLYVTFTQCSFKMSSITRSLAFRLVIDGFALPGLLFEVKDTTSDNIKPLTLLPRELGLPNWDVAQSHTIELQSIIEQGGGGTPILTLNDCFTSIERKA